LQDQEALLDQKQQGRDAGEQFFQEMKHLRQ
jgi:hypothetical protein